MYDQFEFPEISGIVLRDLWRLSQQPLQKAEMPIALLVDRAIPMMMIAEGDQNARSSGVDIVVAESLRVVMGEGAEGTATEWALLKGGLPPLQILSPSLKENARPVVGMCMPLVMNSILQCKQSRPVSAIL